jgi:hypothetical protein
MAKNNEYVPFILSELKKGNTLYSKVFEVFLSKFKCSEPTFVTYWKKAQSEYVLFQQERETKINEATIHQAIETHSNGLKSKSERLMNLQRQADDIQRMLDSNITPDIVKSPKQLEWTEIERKLTYIERAQLMKALRELQAEISKIEGDYAATKMDHTTKGEQLKILQVEIVNAPKN